jgi:hypothetical protein
LDHWPASTRDVIFENVLNLGVVKERDVWLFHKVPEKSSLKIERLRKAGHLAQTISPIYPKCSRIEVYPGIRDAIPDLINSQWREIVGE